MPDTSFPNDFDVPMTPTMRLSKYLKLKPHKSTAVFIDASNLSHSLRSLSILVDFAALRDLINGEGDILRINFYHARFPAEVEDPMVKRIDWLEYNGFNIVTKLIKEQITVQGNRRIKGNMDIEIAVDMMEMADHVEQIVLFSGDGDFRRLVEAVQRKGVRVIVVSTREGNSPTAADELVRLADYYVDLSAIADEIRKKSDKIQPRRSSPNYAEA